MNERPCDVVIVGTGMVGLAVSLQIVRKNLGLKIIVLEKETGIASH